MNPSAIYKHYAPHQTRGRIALYLLNEGQATALQIATALGLRRDSVINRLCELNKSELTTKQKPRAKGKVGAPASVWGLNRNGIQEAIALELASKRKGLL